MFHHKYFSIPAIMVLCLAVNTVQAQETPKEEDFFRISRVSTPEGTLLEVGGLVTLPNGNLAVSTRRGDIYIIENPTSTQPYLKKFASGLHEILGLVYKDGSFYCAQRGELTKLTDTNGDGKADNVETIYAWPLSGHYHEYSFGPVIAPDSTFFVSGNVAFGDQEWWRGESRVPWRGWVMNITADGKMQPFATGVRSPAGLGIYDKELFYTDNQGDWMGSGGVTHLKKGAFAGHPAGLNWANLPNSPLKFTSEELFKFVDERREKDSAGLYIKPENRVDEHFVTLYEAKKKFPVIQLPSVWLPHGILGISNSQILEIPANTFGPFSGQLLVGDQGQSKIMRVFMEKINGEYQGAAWDFRSGFQSGVLRMAWANDGSLFVGETNRGWGSAGEANEGLQRLSYNNKSFFEMLKVMARPDGFEIEFTQPVDKKSAMNPAAYSVESFIYKYHAVYGSPPVYNSNHKVKGVKISEDGKTIRILVDSLKQYHIHHIKLEGIQEAATRNTLIHPDVYYTLNNIPEGNKLSVADLSIEFKEPAKVKQPAVKKPAPAPLKSPDDITSRQSKPAVITYDEIKPLLVKNTCIACHNQDKKQVGPGFKEIAKRNYSVDKIVSLIYNPQPQNWPGYSTEMPPMPQVPKDEAKKIASWIKSLK